MAEAFTTAFSLSRKTGTEEQIHFFSLYFLFPDVQEEREERETLFGREKRERKHFNFHFSTSRSKNKAKSSGKERRETKIDRQRQASRR